MLCAHKKNTRRQRIERRVGKNHTCSRWYCKRRRKYSHAAAADATTHERTRIGRRARLRCILVPLLILLLLMLLLRRRIIVQKRAGEYEVYRLVFFWFLPPPKIRRCFSCARWLKKNYLVHFTSTVVVVLLSQKDERCRNLVVRPPPPPLNVHVY